MGAGFLRYGTPQLVDVLLGMVRGIWEAGAVHQQWKDANLITIYISKGDKADCCNSRGIALLAVAGKILVKLINRRVATNIGGNLKPESQYGFRSSRRTCDMIFVAR